MTDYKMQWFVTKKIFFLPQSPKLLTTFHWQFLNVFLIWIYKFFSSYANFMLFLFNSVFVVIRTAAATAAVAVLVGWWSIEFIRWWTSSLSTFSFFFSFIDPSFNSSFIIKSFPSFIYYIHPCRSIHLLTPHSFFYALLSLISRKFLFFSFRCFVYIC